MNWLHPNNKQALGRQALGSLGRRRLVGLRGEPYLAPGEPEQERANIGKKEPELDKF